METGRRAIGRCKAPVMKTSSDSNFPDLLGHADSPRGSTDRSFGFLFSAFWGVVALAPLRRGGSIRAWALVLAGAFLVISLIRPTLLGPLNQWWQRLGQLLQKLTNPIVMAVLYFSTIVPFALIMRLLNRDVLRLKWDSCQTSYWIPRKPPGPRPESMKDQF
ncbi:SxtJ family membrane protein [Candidatus Binatus sp.]|uniref:SxtJ family membrane protein n=2 Tax=Candidatus Binatus sp. TaxID=2811406 RepID=UPI003BB09627